MPSRSICVVPNVDLTEREGERERERERSRLPAEQETGSIQGA